MQGAGRKKLVELNPHLTCVLCNGYFIDATTIIECLHSFCKTCIVKYLEKNKLCPVCEVQVHKTRPLLNIRSDQTLQDIVYKLVPDLFRNEMARRRQYYASLSPSESSSKPISSEGRGDVRNVERLIFNRDDLISVSLEYTARDVLPIRPLLLGPPPPESKESPPASRRYLLCPGGFTVGHLKKFLRAKFGLSKNHEVDVMYMHDHLLDDYALMDLAYIYSWRRNAPMRLLYRFPVLPPSLMSSSSKADDVVPVPPDEGVSIFIQSTASHPTTDVPSTGTNVSNKGHDPSGDHARANANAVCAAKKPSHVNTASANSSDTDRVSANLSSTTNHVNSGSSQNAISLGNKDSSTVCSAVNSKKPAEPTSMNPESSPVKQPNEASSDKLPQNASSKQGADSEPSNVSIDPPDKTPKPPQIQQPLQNQHSPRSQQPPQSQQPLQQSPQRQQPLQPSPQRQQPLQQSPQRQQSLQQSPQRQQSLQQSPQRQQSLQQSPQRQQPLQPSPQRQQPPQTQQLPQSQQRRSPQIVKLSTGMECSPCLPTAPRVTGVKPGVEQKVSSSANQPAAWLGRAPSTGPPASRVVTSGQRPGSKAAMFSKTTPPSHRKNGLSTANGMHSNLRLILPAPAKPNGVTDSREVLPKATKATTRPSDSPSSPAKRPHLDSRAVKEAAVS